MLNFTADIQDIQDIQGSREELEARNDIDASNEQVAALLKEGCRSTNHALAIMYLGNLEYANLES